MTRDDWNPQGTGWDSSWTWTRLFKAAARPMVEPDACPDYDYVFIAYHETMMAFGEGIQQALMQLGVAMEDFAAGCAQLGQVLTDSRGRWERLARYLERVDYNRDTCRVVTAWEETL